MAQYKRIGSAAHNWAQSFLSLENLDKKGYFVQAILDAARTENASKVVLNVLDGKVSPSRLANDRVASFVGKAAWWFAKQLRKQNVEPSMVQSARVEIIYDFSAQPEIATGYQFAKPEMAPESIPYSAKVVVMDDRGKEYESRLAPWWRT